jgi:hypothetical protein
VVDSQRLVPPLLLTAALLIAASSPDARKPVLGRWHGTSTCTAARAACRNEIVVYHVSAAKKADVVLVTASKVVDGKELEMGTFEFTVDAAKHRMVGEFANANVASRWTFTWTDDHLTGTAILLPSQTKIRDVALTR